MIYKEINMKSNAHIYTAYASFSFDYFGGFVNTAKGSKKKIRRAENILLLTGGLRKPSEIGKAETEIVFVELKAKIKFSFLFDFQLKIKCDNDSSTGGRRRMALINIIKGKFPTQIFCKTQKNDEIKRN